MTTSSLRQRLPEVKGRYQENASLAEITWFRVGGPAEILYKPKDIEDLQFFLQNCPKDIPITVIGVGSNLLVRDGGIDGVVIRLGRGFHEITHEDNIITAGAAALDVNVARYAAEQSLAGLEFLSGIPGTIGGAIRMNAGAYGREVKDVLIKAEGIDLRGKRYEWTARDMPLSYRHNDLPEDLIFTKAVFQGTFDDQAAIITRMDDIRAAREASQPTRGQTGGSTFKNPEGHKAWQLIDAAGCRGLAEGGAQVSPLHCNFFLNTGKASAHDIESLGEEVRRRVKAQSGIDLQWEIKIIGKSEK